MPQEVETPPAEETVVDDYLSHWYILDEAGNPKSITSFDQRAAWEIAHPEEKLLKQEDVQLGDRIFWVSTVFLSLDHGWHYVTGDYRPVLWETMVFERQTETSHLTSSRIKKDAAGNTVYTTYTDWQGIDRPIPEFEEYTLPVGDINYGELYQDRYTSREDALLGHQKAVQWVLDGMQDEDESPLD